MKTEDNPMKRLLAMLLTVVMLLSAASLVPVSCV